MANPPVRPPAKPQGVSATNGAVPKPGGPQAAGKTVHVPVRAPSFRLESASRRARYLKLLIYGNYGVGKTTLAATAVEVPVMNDILMINAEAGDLVLDDDRFQDISSISISNFRTLARVYEYLKRHCVARDANDIETLKQQEAELRGCSPEEIIEPKRFKTVIVDTLSEVEQYCFAQLLGFNENSRMDDEGQAAEFKEYKQNHNMVLRMVRNFRDLPMHVIFTCGESFSEDETKKKKFSPDLTGKLSKKVQGFMDMVGYYMIGNADAQTGKAPRRLCVMPTGRFDAKHRYVAFRGGHFDDPTMKSILEQVGLLSNNGAALK